MKELKLDAYFTAYRSSDDPLNLVEWTKRRIQSDDPVIGGIDVEAPEFWSDTAVTIACTKYFARGDGKLLETSVRTMVERLVRTLVYFADQEKVFARFADLKVFEFELKYILIHQIASFNSPVWFNCGLYHVHGMNGGPGQWRWSAGTCVEVENSFQYPQCSACFIQGLDDDLMSIFELLKSEARVFKYGSGTGTNFSTLRSRHEPLRTGNEAAGLLHFLKIFDVAAGAIKSGGIARRAAKMVCVDADHLEIEDFVQWKVIEEKKAQALIAAGFSDGFEGEAYQSVTGQNANNSVRVNDEFMRAVRDNGVWTLRSRTGHVEKEISARTLWEKICAAAWSCADPGLQFTSAIQEWHTCPNSGPIRASNPCSEYMFVDDTACNLASIRLSKFLNTKTSEIDYDFAGLRAATRILIVAQDLLVDFASYPTPKIAEKSTQFRTLGLGFADLGGLLMQLGLAYDSDLARTWAATVMAFIHGEALMTSAQLAAARRTFLEYEKNTDACLAVLDRQSARAETLATELIKTKPEWAPSHAVFLSKVAPDLRTLWNELSVMAHKSGLRNAQVTAIAPTGTIGLLMDCDTLGIEPELALTKTKYLSGGGTLNFTNQSIRRALVRLGYSDDDQETICDWVGQHGSIEGAPGFLAEHLDVFDCAFATGDQSRAISPMGHVLMMAAVQPFVSGAISKTVNLPAGATVEDVALIFTQAWELGLKSIAIYRDGSKGAQVLEAGIEAALCGTTTGCD